MQHLFLTSSIEIDGVGQSIRARLGHDRPLKTAFVMTPVEGDADQSDLSWVDGERSQLNVNHFVTFDYTITAKTQAEIAHDLADIDVLYVTGGNEFYFKEQCNRSGFTTLVVDFVKSGKPYIGSSCGSIITGVDMTATVQLSDTTMLTQPVDVAGFGLVPFTILPHWGSPEFRDRWLSQDSFNYMYRESAPLIALNNHQYAEVQGDQYQIVDVRHES